MKEIWPSKIGRKFVAPTKKKKNIKKKNILN